MVLMITFMITSECEHILLVSYVFEFPLSHYLHILYQYFKFIITYFIGI